MKKISALHILPCLMIIAALTFGVRFSEFVKNISAGKAYAATGSAERMAVFEPSAGDNVPPPSQEALSEAAAKKAEAEAGAPPSGKPVIQTPSLTPDAPKAAEAKKEPEAADWKASDDVDDEYADVKMEMFSDLSKRRKDLESKEKELVMREALLKAAQAELVQKTNELSTIKTDIETLLKQQTEQEDKRIASLVKIYEGMKAKDAAKIFNSLDMDVLLQVITKMSERKSAPIIAAMNEERARSVTIMLAEQNKLPSLPEMPIQQ